MTLAELICCNSNEYNGHKQLDLDGAMLSFDEALELCNDIQEYLKENEGYNGFRFVYLKTYADGSSSIYAGNYWKAGTHPLGHTDKLMVSFTIRAGE